MISNAPSIKKLLYQQFNARICLVDIYIIYKQIQAKTYSNEEADLLLTCIDNTDETRAFLEKKGYGKLVFDIVKHVEMSDDLENSLLSHYDQELVNIFKKALVHPFDLNNSINFQNEGLKLTTTDFVADIIRYPLSQFHSEIMKACNLFMKLKKNCDEKSIYMESYSPSLLSQYAQFWVAERLNMLDFPSKICVV